MITEAILVAIIVAIPPTIAAIVAIYATRRVRKEVIELHVKINSRTEQLLEAASNLGHAAGVEDERQRKDDSNGHV